MGMAHGLIAAKSAVESRKQEEIDFHNRLATEYLSGGPGHRVSSLKYYDVAERSLGFFRTENFAILKRHFAQIDTRFFHLTVLLSTGLVKFSWGQRLYRALDALDEKLLKIPALRRQAWVTVFVLSRPNKSPQER